MGPGTVDSRLRGVRIPLAVAGGGALGTSLRYAVAVALDSSTAATVAVNIAGSFALAVIAFRWSGAPGRPTSAFLTTGLLGAFTTFSAFAVDANLLVGDGTTSALAYVGVSVLGGLAAVVLARRLVAPVAGAEA